MSAFGMTLASAAAKSPWYHGIQVSERMELLIVGSLFVGTLITVYFIQRWIGDY